MSLKFVFGGSGAGKSTYVLQDMIRSSMQHPDRQYIVMVPDQFTMSTQKLLCSMHERGGIMNIDVQSFSRLTHRISDELGCRPKIMLDDTGKNLILRNVALMAEDRLEILGRKLRRSGYIHEVKSVISEFYQYAVTPGDLEVMIGKAQGKGSLPCKLHDLKILYEDFQAYMQDHYITPEEALDQLCGMIPDSELLRGSEIVFDGFTGFTPIQCRVIHALLQAARRVTVTLCADGREDILYTDNEQKLFALSRQTYSKLCRFAEREHIAIDDPVFLKGAPVRRLADNEQLAFLETALFRSSGLVYEKEADRVLIHESQTLVSEVQRVCLTIRRLIREEGCAYRDFAVVTGDLNRYAHIVRREFDRYCIPYFMDRNRGIVYHPMTECLKAALGLLKYNFSYESVMTYLRSGMSDIERDDADRLALYIRKLGIRGRSVYERRFVRGDEAAQMNGIRERMMDEIAPVMTKMKTARDYVKALYQLCVTLRMQDKCMAFSERCEEQGDLSGAKENEKIYGACMELFDQIYELLGEQELSGDEFLEIFEAGISEIRIGTIPQNVDQVVVGDIERSRLGAIKTLFFIGVNDGVIPGKGEKGGLLSEMEREFLMQLGVEMAPTPRQKIYRQRLYLYQNMTSPTQRLYVSYVRMTGDGKAAQPSYLIRVLCGLYPKLQITNDDMDDRLQPLARIESPQDGLDDMADLLRSYMNGETPVGSGEEERIRTSLVTGGLAYLGDASYERLLKAAATRYEAVNLSSQIAALLYERKKKGSVSRLEKFAACSYAHFLQYGLGLREKEEYEFGQVDFGTVYHEILRELIESLQSDHSSLSELTEAQMKERVDLLTDDMARRYGDVILYSSGRNEYRIEQMKQVLMRSLLTLRYQLAKGNYETLYCEKEFQIKGAFDLIGKIDRVDLCRDGDKSYLKVIDYKSSGRTFQADELYYGLSLQLPLYLYAASQMLAEQRPGDEIVEASMLYFGLGNPILKEEEAPDEAAYQKQLHKNMRMDGLTVENEEVIRSIDRDFKDESDVIKVKMKKDGFYTASSQTVTQEEMKLNLCYAKAKADELMEKMLQGDVSVNPKHMEGSQRDSCSFCPYKQVCRFDQHIQGFSMQELPKLNDEVRKEAMQHAVDAGSGTGRIDEK